MYLERARSKKVATLAASLLLTTFAIGVAGPVAFAPAANAATGTLSGTVYNDYDNNGVKDAGEPGVQGAVVYAYDVDGHQFGPATSASNGVYTLNLTGVTAGAMRLELQSMPTGYEPSRVGTDNATTIRFLNLTAGATINNLHFAIQKPLEYCESNPDIATTAFCMGTGSGTNDLATVFHSTYDSQTITTAATASQTGSVEGVAWDPVTKRVFTSAYIKRHAGLNDTWGADAIYVMDPATNTTSHWVDLASLGIDVGQASIPNNAGRNIVTSSLLSQDPIFSEVGKYGIGDIDTNGTDTLYVTNLFQRTVHSIPIPANGSAPTTSTNLGLPGSAVTCTNGTARPFALTYQDGYIYAGLVCDAATGTTANLDAYVVRKLATDTTTGGWAVVDLNGAAAGSQIDLDYDKGPVYSVVDGSNTSALNKWHIWDDTLDANWDAGANSSSAGNADFMIRPTPMLSDIEFDDDGSLVLAFRDRTADMIGADNNPPDAADRGTPTWTGNSTGGLVFAMSGGDILRVCMVSGALVVDGAAGCPNHDETGAAANNTQGPNSGEFYAGDGNNAHQEISDGHVAIAPRSGQLLLSSMNAEDNTFNSSGIRGLNNTTGARIDAISANYYTSQRPASGQARFGKANGMGDIEALCDAAPLEIGNRIWSDTNGDGVQDPAEAGIDGVTVRLYAATDTTFTTPLGTAVTSGGGQYYFRTGLTDSNLTDNTGGGLAYRTAYVIRVGTAANFASGPLAGMTLSPADQSPTYTYAGTPDAIDSDPASGGTRANMGVTWYPTIAVTAASTLPGHNNHTYDSGFVPPKPYDLALRKTVVSMNGAPAGGSVTFQLEVFNQTADPVNGVTITDYIDTGSFKPMTALPAAGTTGGAAALAYAWENSDTSKPSVTISGVIPGNSSVTLNVTLNIATSFSMSGLVNKAEISKFDNDGNSSNGDSTTGAVYDVDSIPDAINTDALVDDVITGQRWTNTATTQTLNNAVTDEDDHDVATVPLYDLALIKTRSAGQAATVTSPATTASFDITVKNQGQTPVFGVTVLDSPVSPLTRSATTAASQTVTTTLGASVTVTFNSGTGVFTIPTLAAGDTVKFTVIADLAVVNTVQVNGAEITAFDNDSNNANAKPSWVQDADSTPDSIVGNDAILPGTNPAGFPEDSHNLIDNAPVNGVNATDEDDQDTEAVQLGLLRIGSTVYKDANANGTGDAGEEVAGVLVQLFKYNGSAYVLVGSTVTNAGGDYSFDRLFPGTYQVGIPTDQSTATVPTALVEWEPVAGSVAGPETSNFDNDGDAETGFISRSDDVVLTYNGEPTNDTADNADADALTSPRTYTDTNSNLNIDFVFTQVKYELGNLVWSDNGAGNHYNNGKADSDESGINGVTVQLYRDNGAGGAVANDGILAASELIATTTTAGGGFYDFKNLLTASDYHVVIVKSSVPVGLAVAGTPVTVAAADGVDNDNNAAVVVTQGWSSGRIALGPVATAEPTGEKDGTTGADASPTESVADSRADQTVDFGFVPSMRIGNQVWRDESDNNPVTQVSTDNNGVFNAGAGEVGLSGVRVELWRDVSVNGFQAGGDDVLVGFTNTDSNGNYWFDGVRPGDTYFIAVHTIAAGPSTLDRPASSTGQSASVAAADNDDDGAPDAASGYLSVSRAFVPTLGTASMGETDANQVGVGAAETAANARVGVNQYNDNDSQLRIDLGFVNVPVYRIGNLVWLDNGGSPYVTANEANGSADSNEPGIAGVAVQLFAATDTGFVSALATATTDANGEYAFENLIAGDYVVRIPSTGGNATTLAGLTSTSDGLAANADHDNDDNGVISSGGWASTTVTLNAANAFQGGEPETEAHRLGEATSYDNGLSWTTTTSDPATYANNRSNLTVDFGFTQSYRIGNLVWRDTNDDGIAQAGEAGIGGVLVQLLNGSTVVAETVTASDGKYAFTNLAPGNYKVRIPVNQTPVLGPLGGIVPGALSGLVSSDNTDTNANNDEDNDDNGQVIGVSSWDSGTVTLGGASEPTNERLRSNDATDDDASSFADNLSNFSVDFGFWPQMRLGNTVWIDQSDNDPATYAATDNNGVLDAGEAVIANVGVAVWRDGGNGTFDAGTGAGADDTLAGTDITDSEGNWLVDRLQPGTYFVAVETLPAPYTSYVSSLGQSPANSAIDNVDDGAAATDGSGNPYVSVSGPVALVVGSTPVLEADTVPVVDSNGDANAEAEANRTSGFTVRDSDSDLTVDVSFVAPPTYRIGNLVWLDTNRNGVANAGESGIPGVLVQLLNSAGVVINETVTDGSGKYAFTTNSVGVPLAAGDYRIVIPSAQTQTLGLGLTIAPSALSNLSATAYAGDPDTVLVDNDSNGDAIAGGWQSTLVTLGGGTTTFETEPVTETVRTADATDDDFGWAAGTDGRSEFTVDFGFFPGLRLGDTVWFDDGRTGPATSSAAQENDGIYQATELPAAGVDVELWSDDGDGVFDASTDTYLATQVTDAQGEYFFIGLDEAEKYFAVIPSGAGNADGANNNGTVLAGWRSSTVATAATTTGNDTDHGDDLTTSDAYAATSQLITPVRGGMAYGEAADEANANTKTGVTLSDADSNLVIDFGFSPAPSYQLGNLVWLDANDNGIVDSGEAGIGGVTVQLFLDDGDGVFEPGTDDGGPIATDTTGTTGTDKGRYEFPGLAAGTYFVYLPTQSALNGMDSSQVREADANNDVDNDNNSIPFGGPLAGFVSSAVELGDIAGAGENAEPTGEVDGNTAATAEDGAVFDERSNQTVDFGFAKRARIGNQVWRDESDANNATHAATDNNGVFDAASGEVGIAGVTVELWRDVAGDGIELGDDDVLVASTMTNSEGNYWFDNLIPGANFYVAIPSVGSPLTTARSSAGVSATPAAADNDDDGDAFGGYVSVSTRFPVAASGATLNEADAVEPGDGTSTTDANAEVEANVLPRATFPDASSELAIDFGFIEVPLYRIGNLVWLDSNNDGVADSTESPLVGVLVQLLNSGGTVIAETVSDANGEYAFANLVAGDYSVRIPSSQVETLGGGLTINATALANLASSTTDAADPNSEATDNDDNGVTVAAGWQSGTVTLGSTTDASATETEPTTEKDFRTAADDDNGWANGTDARSNFTVDFGFYELLRLGDIVWLDNGGNGGGYNPANEDNGVFDAATETLISGVSVNLYRDNGDGVFDTADDALVGTTVTASGTYYFTGLTEGDYFVAIPDSELGAGQELEGLHSSTGQAANFATNDRDQGAPAAGFAAVSQVITLTANGMSNGDSTFEARANTRTGVTVSDASSQLAVDFGFVPEATYALGNLVWEDLNNDGLVSAGEPGLSGISVELYQDNGAGGATAGDGVLAASERVATDVTDGSGRYLFQNLAAGDYIVRIPATETDLDGWYVGGEPLPGIPVAAAGNETDNDNNAVPDSLNGGGYTSGVVTLGEGSDHEEPTGEVDANTSASAETPVSIRDDRSDQTVDFGFWRGLRLGNQVWLDEGAGAHQNNGTYDADELPLTGLSVELWADGGDGNFDAGAGDDTLVDSTTTGAEGRYFFEHVAPGDYFVAIASSPVGTVSSTGRVGTGLTDDGLDDGDATGGYVSVSQLLTLAEESAPTGELDGPGVTTDDAEAFANAATSTYQDDQSYLTVDFGLVNVPLYRIGNLVWNDGNNDGLAQTGEPGVDGVLVQLTDSSGTVLEETVTAGGGYYAFDSLVAGTYRVQIPSAQTTTNVALAALIVPTALDGFHPSTVVSTTPADEVDNDSNGVPTGSVNRSGLITLGGTEPVTEQLRVDDVTDDDLGLASPRIDDNRSDFTVDFGYYSISLGNQVFFDVNGNGIYEPAGGDHGIDGVTVVLRDAGGAYVDSAVTAGGGQYLFTGLVAGTGYYVEIPASEFGTTGDLNGLFSSVGDAGSTDDSNLDGVDRGVDSAPFAAVRSSGVWTASASSAPTVTDGISPNPDNDAIRPDAAENLVVDFGFYQMELGGTVFLDPTNDGIDDSDGDFADVTVLLYHGDGSPYLRADGSQASTVTDSNGNYVFSGLPVGQYIVEIPASEFTQELDGYSNSDGNDPVPSPDNDVTGEDNGYPVSGDIFSGGAVRTQVVTLNLAAEPTDDQSPTSGYADDMSNLSVDFGFWHAQAGLELGNQIWFDSDKDGLYNHGESPAPAGVVVQLLDADTLAVLATTTTDSAGQYRFTELVAGRYIVKLPPVNFIEGGLLAGYMATDGAGVSGNPNDGTDSDSNALPLSVAGISSAAVTLKAAAPINEADPASQGVQDRQSNLTVDFGLVLGTPESLAHTGAELPLRQTGLLFALGLALLVVSRRRREE